MTRLIPLMLAALLGLVACGGPDHPRGGAPVVAGTPRFGDARPVDWKGDGPDRHQVHGLDVSKYQGQIDWPTARRAGVSFAFIKATEGGDRVDDRFLENWRATERAGVPRGAYHFYYLCRPAAEQARWFIAHVPRDPGALPPVLDMEWTPFSPTCTIRPDAGHIRAEAKIFLDMLEAHYGQAPILYSPVEFWQDNEMWRIPGRHDYWLRSTARHPAEAYGGQPWTFWQYTGTGLVEGVTGQVDINVFHGNARQWADWVERRRY